jgi:hypothetical protein
VFDEFLAQLLAQGTIVFRSARAPQDRPSPQAVATLAAAFDSFRLGVAGPLIPFDTDVGLAAAEFVRQASFALVNRSDLVQTSQKRMRMPRRPATPSHHLSADLTLRYVPQIVRRARGLDPSDPLIDVLESVVSHWPLSGVLSDGDFPPALPLDFGGHPGLLLLYAERLVQNDRPTWRPRPPDPAWDYYELVLREHNRGAETITSAAASK